MALSHSPPPQAVKERKKELEEERGKALLERMRKREEQLARTDEAKRQEARDRERKAEDYAKKVAGLKEAAHERDEQAVRKHQDRMDTSAANRAKELERIKIKAEQAHAKHHAVGEKKAAPAPAGKSVAEILRDLGDEKGGNRKKRTSRIALTMEKMSQEYHAKLAKEEGAADGKSRLSKQVNKLRYG